LAQLMGIDPFRLLLLILKVLKRAAVLPHASGRVPVSLLLLMSRAKT
jgi:hypothetical protein